MAKLYYIAPVEFEATGWLTADIFDKFLARMPFDGEILGNRSQPCTTGCIMDAGAGITTQIQIRNLTQNRDYFTTEPEFRVADADVNGRAPLSGGQLGSNPTAKAGDWLALRTPAVSAGALMAFITILMGFWREV